jgi:hypothetical protein
MSYYLGASIVLGAVDMTTYNLRSSSAANLKRTGPRVESK